MNNSKEIQQFDVLVITEHYLPGRMAGGPVTTISNMMRSLKHERRFLVVTLNFDIDGVPYRGITPGAIYEVEGTFVIYLTRKYFTPYNFNKLLIKYGIPYIYLNSFFAVSTVQTLVYSKFFAINASLILAPRGEFSSGALRLKSAKKQIYLYFFQKMQLLRSISVLQASSLYEERDIWKVLGPVRTVVAPDLPDSIAIHNLPQTSQSHERRDPSFVFISRISPKKNLIYALEVLRAFSNPCDFHVYGPQEDKEYWATCQRLIEKMPDNVRVKYCGILPHERIQEVFSQYDAFLFPTAGENYGHVIFEALAAGCPVILSDQTPWRDLDSSGVGWVLSLEQPEGFVKALETVAELSAEEMQQMRTRCIRYAQRVSQDPYVIAENLALFPK